MQSTSTFSNREKWILFLLGAIHFAHVMDFMIIMPLGPQFMRDLDLNATQFGFLVSSYTFSAGIANLFGVFLLDRFDRKRSLVFAFSGHIAATLACAWAPHYMAFLAARIMAGAFGGIVQALIFAFIADCFEIKRRGTATGLVMSAFSVASVVGVPFGLFLATWLEWHAPFLLLAGLSLPILIATYFKLPAANVSSEGETGGMNSLRYVITQKTHWVAFSLTTLLMFAGFTVIPFISPSLVANAAMPESQLPWIYFFGGICTFFSSPWFGRLSDRYGPQKVFKVLAFISIAPLLLVTQLGPAPLPYLLLITTSFMVFVGGRFVPAMTLVLSAVNPRYRGSFMSLNTAIQQLAAGLASLLSAHLIIEEAGRLENYEVVGFVAIAATMMTLFISPKVKSWSAAPRQ